MRPQPHETDKGWERPAPAAHQIVERRPPKHCDDAAPNHVLSSKQLQERGLACKHMPWWVQW